MKKEIFVIISVVEAIIIIINLIIIFNGSFLIRNNPGRSHVDFDDTFWEILENKCRSLESGKKDSIVYLLAEQNLAISEEFSLNSVVVEKDIFTCNATISLSQKRELTQVINFNDRVDVVVIRSNESK